ncbi:MAG: hypothetical protein Q8N85_02180 [Candidatus Omnitrophota bacterium]|nr:hypothetical protein [Candidatus Omnitrophota bacterium]
MKNLIRLLILALFMLPIAYNLSPITSAYAATVPHLINYQGRLTDASGAPLSGAYTITFKIYDAKDDPGTISWEETYENLNIQKGIFSVMLGSKTDLNLPFNKPYFLEIKVKDPRTGSEEVMDPRQQITSAGYAYMSENTLSVPRGLIVMWSGRILNIPTGWQLCDGTNGTPDLRDRFTVGAGQGYDVGATGGEARHTLTTEEMPAHSHTYSKAHGDQGHAGGSGTSGQTVANSTDSTSSTGGGQLHENRPPYYALAYIMKL